ncbi:ATP-binding protein [Pseudoduganella sp. GCM10020061]|uniref:ATP-binding protein n=1 Tax=Pseudoduganella sp. GCM10020061 TaxID=3317345 RepID=UPI003645B9AB
MALLLIAASLGMFLALIPFADHDVGVADWFIPLYQPIVVVNDLITAALLFGYLRLYRQYSILILACGYLYSAVMAIVHLLTFPGALAPAGLLGGGAQTTGYLHVFWHIGFPVAVIGYSLFKERDRTYSHARTEAQAILITFACAMALSALAVLGNDILPPMLDGDRYSAWFNLGRYSPWVLSAVALVVMYRRRSPSALDLWLMVVLSAWFFEVGLVSIFNAGRWDVGFYAGRVYAVFASVFVLLMLLTEHVSMYRDLSKAEKTAHSAARLRERQETLRLALQAGRMGVFSRDVKSALTWWSPEVEHMLGLAPRSLRPDAEAFMQYVDPEDRDPLRRAITECIRNNTDCEMEFRVRNARGELLWAQLRGKAEYDEDDGTPLSVFGVIADITDRKRRQEADEEHAAHFRTLANELPQLAWMSEPDGYVSWLNRRWYEYTGLDAEGSEGWRWQQSCAPQDLTESLERWRRSSSTGEPYEMVTHLRGADGAYRPFLTRIVPLKDREGRVLQWFGTHTDIAAQTQAQDALRLADQRKDEFLATLAHELRNPLAPIRNAITLINMIGQTPPHVQSALTVIDRQSRHLSRLVDDLLEVARITQRKVTLQKKTVSLVDCMADALHAVDESFKAAGHEVSLHLPDDPLYADADATRIVQCFVNLLTNAIKFTPRGGRIRIDAEREADEVRIAVSDTGIGVAPENLEPIFGLFSQLAPSLERSQGGLGIGLSLVKGFVELHGGTVVASSEGLGHGTTFTVRLPLLRLAPQAAPEQPRASHEARTRPRRILVVDDNLDAASSMVALLQVSGHQVREAHDGPAALEMAAQFAPDVVLLDIGMPGMSGLEVARELRNREHDQRSLIIAVTGWGQERDRMLTREAGFDFHLTKPVNHTELDVLLA